MATRANVFSIDWNEAPAAIRNFFTTDNEIRINGPRQEFPTEPFLFANQLRHGDIIQIDQQNQLYLFYDQTRHVVVPPVEYNDIDAAQVLSVLTL